MAANMWKNSSKNIESDNNKILCETLLNIFLQRNGTYSLNKPHNSALKWQYFVYTQKLISILNILCFNIKY